MAGSNTELQDLTKKNSACSHEHIWYGGQLGEKQILVNEYENSETAEVITITMNDEPLEVVDILKYLCMMKYGKSETEINIRMAATTALVRLITIW